MKRFSAVRTYVTLSIAAGFVATALVMPAIASAQSAAPQTCADATSTASADADASLNEQSPTENFGADTTLNVMSAAIRENSRALVRFPLPQAPAGCVAQSATLRLYSESPPERPSILQVLRLTSAWGETNINWENQPASAGPAAETWGGFGYVQWDVTAHVQAMYAGGNHGFLIRHAIENHEFGAEAAFFSKEQLEFPPQLVVCFAGCPSAGGAPPPPPPPPPVIVEQPVYPPVLPIPPVQPPPPPGTPGATPPPGATAADRSGQPLGPTVAQLAAVLGADLRTAAGTLRRLGLAAILRKQGANVKSVHALIPGTIRISAVFGGKRVVVLRGARSFARAGEATLRLTLTKRGRQVLRRKRSAKLTLRGSFADRTAVIRAPSVKVTLKRRGGR